VTHYRLSLVYRASGRIAEAQKELAEFQRLKDRKEQLKQVYEEMRLKPVKQENPTPISRNSERGPLRVCAGMTA